MGELSNGKIYYEMHNIFNEYNGIRKSCFLLLMTHKLIVSNLEASIRSMISYELL